MLCSLILKIKSFKVQIIQVSYLNIDTELFASYKATFFYILQFELMKLVENCGFSPQILKDSVFDKNFKNDTNTMYYTHDYTRHVFLSKINFHYIIKDYSLQKIQFAFQASLMLRTIEHFCQEKKSKFL